MRKHVLLPAVAALALVPSSAWAYGYGGSSNPMLGVELQYDYVQNVDISDMGARNYTQSNSTSFDAQVKQQRGLAKWYYRVPGGLQFALIGGASFSNKVTAKSTFLNGSGAIVDTTTETWNFDTSPTYGLSMGYDVFASSPVRLVPSLSWLHTHLKGTSGSVNNSQGNCSYGYDGSASTCTTLFGFSANGTIQEAMDEDAIAARLEFAWAVSGDGTTSGFTVRGGGEEAMVVLAGKITHVLPNGSSSAEEHYHFSSIRPQGAFAGLSWYLGNVALGAEARGLSQTTYSGTVGMSF